MTTTLSINLLKNRHTLSEREYQREQEMYKYSLIGLVVAVVVTLAVVSYQLILAGKLKKIEATIATATAQLAGYTDANAKQIYLKSRLKLISSFLDARSISREALQNVFSINIPGVVLSGVNFEADNVVSVNFTADDVLVMSGLLDYLQQDNGFFVQAVSEGITRSAEGKYQLQARLTIPER